MKNKLMNVKEAITQIEDGMSIMIGGFMAVGTPELLISELIHQGTGNLTVICNDAGVPGKGAGKLVETGRINKYYASHVGLNPEFGNLMNNGKIEAILVPQGTLAERIRAGGNGLGGILTPTGVGTEVEKGKEVITVDNKKYLLELPLKADISLVKAHTADKSGNLIFRKSARNFNPLMAMASEYTIVEAEHIVETGTLEPDSVMLPGLFVNAVVQGGK
jgi:acetate CoA/acetoacetate CoA-transferase alpha subunit